MVSTHQEIDALVANQVDESMLLSDASRPDVGADVAKGFWFADPLKRISEYGFDQPQDP